MDVGLDQKQPSEAGNIVTTEFYRDQDEACEVICCATAFLLQASIGTEERSRDDQTDVEFLRRALDHRSCWSCMWRKRRR